MTKRFPWKIVSVITLILVLLAAYLLLKDYFPFTEKANTADEQTAESTGNSEEYPLQEEPAPLMLTSDGEQDPHQENAATKARKEEEKQNEKILLDVPLINQMDSPRLYNGCEVTSLAMVLNYKGIKVTKNELANKIKRVPFRYENGLRGNPNEGFVGNMEDGPGLGVYSGPIIDLAREYVETEIKDLTGQPFDNLLEEVAKENPVWIISTSNFVPVGNFVTWQTPQGPIDITFSMHSGVITGFEEDYIYVNNPYGTKDQRNARESFIKAWEQMGSQAIVIY